MKTAIITGANGGIGQQLSQALANAEYTIIMACKNKAESESICSQIKKKTNCNSIEVMELDLASFVSIRQFVEEFQSKYGRLDVLLNNAGVLCHSPKKTKEHVEYTIGVNYLGSYILTELLHPMMNKGAKIINTVSLMLRYGKINPDFFQFDPSHFNRFTQYSNSKLALYYATLDWAEKWEKENITVNCVDPGIVSTNIIRMGNKFIDKLCDIFYRPLIRTPKQGADTIIYLLTNKEIEPITGQVFKSRKIKKIPYELLNNQQRELLRTQTQEFLTQHPISHEISF
jgi:NAD(P)-dependent dehydrogenase (short-subunit alcohol dehydrogenase family)